MMDLSQYSMIAFVDNDNTLLAAILPQEGLCIEIDGTKVLFLKDSERPEIPLNDMTPEQIQSWLDTVSPDDFENTEDV
jgi:hypothetical protein